MRAFIFLILLGTLLSSCYRDFERLEPRLSEEVMIKVLADLHLAEARIADYNSVANAQKDSLAAYDYYRVFAIHQVDTADFQQSIEAYMSDPERMEQLYEKVLTQLQQARSTYGANEASSETPKAQEQKEAPAQVDSTARDSTRPKKPRGLLPFNK